MNTHFRTTLWSLLLAVSLALPAQLWAQTALNTSTLAAAITDRTATIFTVTSATNVTADDILVVDQEAILIDAVSGTRVTGQRGYAGTVATTHYILAPFYNGAPREFYQDDPRGSCTVANELFQPHISLPHPGQRDLRFYTCTVAGVWVYWTGDRERPYAAPGNSTYWVTRENFDHGFTGMRDDGTALIDTVDGAVNQVYGSVLGPITYREELAKTTDSYIVNDGVLAVSADDDFDEDGVEITFGAGGGAVEDSINSFIRAQTTGACISALVDIADISGTDEVMIGFRQNEAFDAATPLFSGTYTEYNVVGVNNVDGSIVSGQEATDTDDSGVNWADGEERALKVCISATLAIPTAYYSDASPGDHPIYNAITMTNTGTNFAAALDVIPFFTHAQEGTDGPTVTILWLQLEFAP